MTFSNTLIFNSLWHYQLSIIIYQLLSAIRVLIRVIRVKYSHFFQILILTSDSSKLQR